MQRRCRRPRASLSVQVATRVCAATAWQAQRCTVVPAAPPVMQQVTRSQLLHMQQRELGAAACSEQQRESSMRHTRAKLRTQCAPCSADCCSLCSTWLAPDVVLARDNAKAQGRQVAEQQRHVRRLARRRLRHDRRPAGLIAQVHLDDNLREVGRWQCVAAGTEAAVHACQAAVSSTTRCQRRPAQAAPHLARQRHVVAQLCEHRRLCKQERQAQVVE